jgi:signal peptidase I
MLLHCQACHRATPLRRHFGASRAMRESCFFLFHNCFKRRSPGRRIATMNKPSPFNPVTDMKSAVVKDKPPAGAPDKSGAAKPAPEGSKTPARSQDNWRETVESVVVAFVLAFLFRTFEAEAFVIPTGSMAPTLYGQHRDVYCEKCGTRFAVGATVGTTGDSEIHGGEVDPNYRTHFAVCPNAGCRYPNDVLAAEIFAGDRILVNKFPYDFGTPERWDVGVFKFPEEAKTNYIKRIVGLPGEEVRIDRGDIYVRKPDGGDGKFRIARKTPDKQRQLQMLVHDNDRPARALLAAGFPESWAAEEEGEWSIDAEARAFRVDPKVGDAARTQWLRYRHYVPSAMEWNRVLSGKPLVSRPQRQFISDFYAYNAKVSHREAMDAVTRGELPSDQPERSNWVGDLTLNGTVDVLAAEGEIVLELSEGSERFRCAIDLKTGQGTFARLLERDEDDLNAEVLGESFDTGIDKEGEYDFSFANVDDRLCLWIDGRLIKTLEFEEGSRFELENPRPSNPTDWDYEPAGIGARGAQVRVSHLLLQRDVYYEDGTPGQASTFQLADSADDQEDEFLALGDNSPRSKDSRLWSMGPGVPRKLLVGKAFFIYWPHAVPFLNDGRGIPVLKYPDSTTEDVRRQLKEVTKKLKDSKSEFRREQLEQEREQLERRLEQLLGEAERRERPPLPKLSLPFYPQVERMKRIR